MQSLNDVERKQVLGEVAADELKAKHEYVKIPIIKEAIHHVKVATNEVNDRLSVIGNVIKGHESDIRKLKRRVT